MDNLLTTISFSIYSNKGVYALLLGSGISRAAGIPTGWDIVIDLIRKLAAQNGEVCTPNEEAWFKNKYNKYPDYSTILSKLVSKASERVNLLRPYFEPTKEEKENHLKEPTKAHKAIASLAKKGYIKVVITTNFDRLLEKALEEEGITPQVVCHVDDITGAMPIVHSNFTIIKINGDYIDCRFLNTKEELENYPDQLKRYVSQIINDFGLITCGWSGIWDIGLIKILKQSENFRYSSFWSYISNCEEELKTLAEKRKGQVIEIRNADSLFCEISERVEALENINDNHPLNASIAVERLKRYIVKDEGKIQLYDLLHNEQENAYNKIQQINDFSQYPTNELFEKRMKEYESAIEILLPLVINGIYWCEPNHENIFLEIIKRMAEPIQQELYSCYEMTKKLHYYPSILIFYAMGICALERGNFLFLKKLLKIKIPENSHEYSQKTFIIKKLNSCLFNNQDFNKLFNLRAHTPFSNLLCDKIYPLFKKYITNEKHFKENFDIFEYYISLNYSYIVKSDYPWAPWGQYVYRRRQYDRTSDSPWNDLLKQADTEKENWAPIKAGMFGGKYSEFITTKEKVENFIEKLNIY